MYINNIQNILTPLDFWLAKEYFKQICQILDSLHYLLFGNQAFSHRFLLELFLPSLPLVFLSSRSSSGAVLPCFFI